LIEIRNLKRKTINDYGEYEGRQIDLLLNKEKDIIDCFYNDDKNDCFLLINNLNEEFIKNLIKNKYHYLRNPNILKGTEVNNCLEEVIDILSNEGIVYDRGSNKLFVSKLKRNNFIRKLGNNLVLFNESQNDFFSKRAKLYTEIPEFKNQVFNVSHILTDSSGGRLFSKSVHTEFDLDYISFYKPRIRVNKKSIKCFNIELKKTVGFNFPSCSILDEHNHENDDIPRFCLKTFCFETLDKERKIIEINEDTLLKTAIKIDLINKNNKFEQLLLSRVSIKSEEFRKKGK